MKKIFKKLLIASVAASSFIFSPPLDGTNFFPTVQAEIKTYIGVGKGTQSELVTAAKAKEYARLRAEINAKDQAGVYLRGYTKMQNFNLTENKIEVITNSIVNIVGEVNYTQKPFDLDGVPVVVYTATLQANIDTDGINAYINREDKAEFQSMRREIIETLNKIDNLIERYNRATTQEEKDKIRAELTKADRNILSGQKVNEGLALYEQGAYQKAKYLQSIKLYNEAIELNPNNYVAYNNRGNVYAELENYEQAIQDYNKAIEINPNNPNFIYPYYSRGNVYRTYRGKQYEKALADFNKVIDLNPDYDRVYFAVAMTYYSMNNFEQAIVNVTKAIELFEQDIANVTTITEIHQYYAYYYQLRALCYEKLGEKEKEAKDISKFAELLSKK